MPTYLERAINDGHAEIQGEGKNEKITYIAANHTERYSDPEEKVRAEFWAELIYKYEYPPERMLFEVKVERRTPDDRADIVIYSDDELKDRYFVFECKRPDITGAEFDQSIEQACGNRASMGAKYCGAVAGLTRRMLRFDKFPAGERAKNLMTDIPIRYGNPVTTQSELRRKAKKGVKNSNADKADTE
jgi:type I restriction enzyme M protein